MSAPPSREHDAPSTDENAVRALYRQMLEGWNTCNAQAFAAPFAEDGEVIGFDGSQMSGSAEIAATLQQIFADHVTAPYVSKVRSVRLLSPDASVLRAIVGMVPPGQEDLNCRRAGSRFGGQYSSPTSYNRSSVAAWTSRSYSQRGAGVVAGSRTATVV
jgi:uncharacterized protein (TIGR02246 family)